MQGSTQLLRSQTGYTPTQAGYSNGVFRTYFTTPWTQGQFEASKAICAFQVPDTLILLVDMGLYNAGWRMAQHVAMFDSIELPGEQAKFCWAQEPSILEVVSANANPNHQDLLTRIYADGPS
jgi:hypothetical protein